MTTDSNDLSQDGDQPSADEEISQGDEMPSDLTIEEQVMFLRNALESSRNELDQSLDATQRAQAELVNYKRRTDDERIELGKYSNSRLISRILPVMEELDLAVNHAGDSGPNDSWLEGVKLIQRKLSNLLQSEGVQEIETVGIPFNPVEHEALGTEPTEEHPPGYITEAVRPGYRLHDRVIQPAQVMVAREPESPQN
ncbi:MAG: nucleotide exchange factor GrpE [SAR202 cluster bacterium Io17-Chloro-G4]|nr:MAG: nucleotide exchange factor GrpE [SAR202 cluster bacterium Io17-Chloro-G4]